MEKKAGDGLCASPIKTIAPNAEWQSRIDLEWWARKNISSPLFYSPPGTPLETTRKQWEQFFALHQILLRLGGHETCFPAIEEDMEAILSRGKLWPGKSKTMRGKPCQCHRNVLRLWVLNEGHHDVAVATGYALSKDGLWRQHSWLLYNRDGTEIVIETTEKRVAYYGVAFSREEAEAMARETTL